MHAVKNRLAHLAFSFAVVLTLVQPAFALPTKTAEPQRIGLFIASVDPITEAHMDVINAGIDQLHLNKVIIMVNSSSDKDYSASVSERIGLVEAALASAPHPSVSFEIMTEPPEGKRDFAINVARSEGGGVLYQIAGQDVQPKATELFSQVPEVQSYILARLNPGETTPVADLMPGFHWLKSTHVTSTSSTEVKNRLEHDESVAGLLDPHVLSEIRRQGLYSPLSAGQAVIRGRTLAVKLHQLIKDMRSSPWSELSVADLADKESFVLRSDSNAHDNVSFNRIQSMSASEELIIRLILKQSPKLSKADQYEFRQWALSEFQKPIFSVIDHQEKIEMRAVAPACPRVLIEGGL